MSTPLDRRRPPRLLGVPLGIWVVVALLLAVVWSLVWPQERGADLDGWRWGVVRWGHAVTWLLVAVALAGRAGSDRVARTITDVGAVAAGASYLTFVLVAFVLD